MLIWLLAAAAGTGVAAVAYGWREPRRLASRAVPAALRAAALTALLAALFDAPAGRSRLPEPIVALDASLSWLRGRDSAAWHSALDRARDAGDSLILFGDSVRPAGNGPRPVDRASRIRPIVGRALAAGRPLLAITDGAIDDPDALAMLPSGSRIEVMGHDVPGDAALAGIEVPRTHMRGDTLEARVTVTSGAGGAEAGRLMLIAGERTIADVVLDRLTPFAERSVAVRGVVGEGEGPTVVRIVVMARNDPEPRNDTLTSVIDISEAAGAVFVSASPDFDSRAAVSVLRGALSLPTRVYYRVAPNEWRVDGSLAATAEQEVRRAVRAAPLVILHGDTLVLGPPRSITDGALALLPQVREQGDWYAVAAPPSPLAGALSGIRWDSLPPLDVLPTLPAGDWQGLETRRARQFERRVAIIGVERPRRHVIVGAAGLWRWQFRGSASADAHAALWGSIFDWLLEDRSRPRAVSAADPIVRAGEPIRWRRGSAADSVVRIALAPRSDPLSVDTVTLDFAGGVNIAESPPLDAGVYEATHAGGRTLLAVSGSREWLPRAITVTGGDVGEAPSVGDAPRVRTQPWTYVVALALLCVEWIARRRRGWR